MSIRGLRPMIVILMFGVCVLVSGRDSTRSPLDFEIGSDWDFTIASGGIMTFGENEQYMRLSDRLAHSFDFRVTKWFAPYIGMMVGMDNYQYKGLCTDAWAMQRFRTDRMYANPTGFDYSDSQTLYIQDARCLNLYLSTVVDFLKIIGQETDFYRLMPTLGVGWLHSYAHGGESGNTITMNLGVVNRFRLNDVLSLDLTLKGALYDDSFDGEVTGRMPKPDGTIECFKAKNVPFDGNLSLSIGLTYSIGSKRVNAAKPESEPTALRSVERYNDTGLGRLLRENNIPDVNNSYVVESTDVVTGHDQTQRLVFEVAFEGNNDELSDSQRQRLAQIGRVINDNPDCVFKISYYTPIDAACDQDSEWLSQYRVNSVYRQLKGIYRVPERQLVRTSEYVEPVDTSKACVIVYLAE